MFMGPELKPARLRPRVKGKAMRTSQFSFARCGARVSQRPLTLALALALGTVPLAGLAATISVFTTDDAGSATDCTLRQAIISMNTSSVSGTGCVNSDLLPHHGQGTRDLPAPAAVR